MTAIYVCQPASMHNADMSIEDREQSAEQQEQERLAAHVPERWAGSPPDRARLDPIQCEAKLTVILVLVNLAREADCYRRAGAVARQQDTVYSHPRRQREATPGGSCDIEPHRWRGYAARTPAVGAHP